MAIKVNCIVSGDVAIPKSKDLSRLAAKVLRDEKMDGNVNLIFCENDHVRKLNKQFRKLDKVTDVLSFLYEEEEMLGEIYIASAQAKKQAPKWKNTFYDELKRLVVHGSLHLAGFDHMNNRDRKQMRAMEDLYLGLNKT